MVRPLDPTDPETVESLTAALPDAICSCEIEGLPAVADVRHATLREALSRPFTLDLLLEVDASALDVEALVGRACEFAFDRRAVLRTVHGIVERAEAVSGASFGDRTALRVRVVPALAFLAHRVNARIFQGVTSLEIVRDVLLGTSAPSGGPREGLAAFERTIDDAALDPARYEPARDFCVQYDESDLAFVSRLLEEEGIAYRFDDDGTHEVMTLSDDNGSFPLVETSHGTPDLPLLDGGVVDVAEGLLAFGWERVRRADDVLRRHWDFLTPTEGVDHHATAEARRRDPIVSYTLAVERGRHEIEGDAPRRIHDVQARAAQRDQELLRGGDWIGRGSANAIGVAAGHVFHVESGEHPRALVVSVVHEFHAADRGAPGAVAYHNELVAIPATVRYRPPRSTPRPIVVGPQTAIVTGPPGEEIHTDAFGRIKVLFHWDRDGIDGRGRAQRHDPGSSAWVRVAHSWAGSGFGTMFIPRVGMEVVVAFLDGNPDRPLVVGCVYNGDNRPPLALPDEKARSTIRTASTPSAEAANEIRFDDTRGLEEILVHARRDHSERVERRHTREVGEEEHLHVERHRHRTVGGDEKVTVEGNQRITVHGGGEGDVTGIEVRVDRQYHVVSSGDVYVEAPERIELVCGESSIVMTPERIELHAGGRAILELDANVLARSSVASELRLDDGGEMRASQGAGLLVTATAVLESNAAQAGLELAAGAVLHGDDARIETGATSLMCDGSSATVTSSAIALNGGDETVIDGGGGRGVFASGLVRLD